MGCRRRDAADCTAPMDPDAVGAHTLVCLHVCAQVCTLACVRNGERVSTWSVAVRACSCVCTRVRVCWWVWRWRQPGF